MQVPAWFEQDVSRETLDRLTVFSNLVSKWNGAINLVSRASLADLESRHIWDSAQIWGLATSDIWLDIGSGGGFPGIVIAIFALAERPNQVTVLVESDHRKAAFLRTAIRELRLNAVVHSVRIEDLPPQKAGVLSARALSGLSELLAHAQRHLAPGGTALFPKGSRWQTEVNMARKVWNFDLEDHRSRTEPEAAILEIKDVHLV